MTITRSVENEPETDSNGTLIEPLNVLLIAYACEPGRGSEPGTGWNMALGLARFHRVTVATRANNRPVIERFLEHNDCPTPDFLYVDPPSWALRLKSLHILPVQLFYLFWQREVDRILKKQGVAFDILHQLTFNSFEVPPLAFKDATGVKIWGPVGGGQTVAGPMLAAFSGLDRVKEWVRNLRVRASAANPLCGRILRECSLVLFANHETQRLLVNRCFRETGMMIDVGVDAGKFSTLDQRPRRAKLTLLSAGRLESRKGVILLIKAFERLAPKYPQLELRIVGTGPLLNVLGKFVRTHQLSDRVVFTGAISHDMMTREFETADVFVFPSLRDTSGAVVLEAMAMALPVVCFDHQGAALMVDDSCGIRVSGKGIQECVEALGNAIEHLILNRDLRHTCGMNARRSAVGRHDWRVKVERINDYYRRLTSNEQSSIAAESHQPS